LRPCRRSDVLSEFLPDGSAVVYDPRTELAYSLTATAAVIWETCDGTHTSDAMVEQLTGLFEASADVIEGDVQALLGHLSELGLLEPTAGAAG